MTKNRQRVLLAIGVIIMGIFLFSTILDIEYKNIQIENQKETIEELNTRLETVTTEIENNVRDLNLMEVDIRQIDNNLFDITTKLKERGLIK